MSSSTTAKKPAPIIRTVVPGNRTLEEIYEDEAREIVDEAIENARRRLSSCDGGSLARDGEAPEVKDDEPTIDPETGYEIPNIKWMTADNFTVAGGLEKIEEFVKASLKSLIITEFHLAALGLQEFLEFSVPYSLPNILCISD